MRERAVCLIGLRERRIAVLREVSIARGTTAFLARALDGLADPGLGKRRTGTAGTDTITRKGLQMKIKIERVVIIRDL